MLVIFILNNNVKSTPLAVEIANSSFHIAEKDSVTPTEALPQYQFWLFFVLHSPESSSTRKKTKIAKN
jgi:hypothetical protein